MQKVCWQQQAFLFKYRLDKLMLQEYE